MNCIICFNSPTKVSKSEGFFDENLKKFIVARTRRCPHCKSTFTTKECLDNIRVRGIPHHQMTKEKRPF